MAIILFMMLLWRVIYPLWSIWLMNKGVTHHDCLKQNKTTPLYHAASNGHLDIVKFLTLEKHCNPTSRTSSGTTLIHRAAQYGHLEILKFFITDLKCSPTIPGQYGHTPLHYATDTGRLHIMKYLIHEQGCDPSCLDGRKQTPLHRAAAFGQLDILRFLALEKHCNPNQSDIWNNTPLHYAARKGHLQLVQFFVEELKCSPNIRGHQNAKHLTSWLKPWAIAIWLSTYRSFNIQLTSSDYSKLLLFVYILKLVWFLVLLLLCMCYTNFVLLYTSYIFAFWHA